MKPIDFVNLAFNAFLCVVWGWFLWTMWCERKEEKARQKEFEQQMEKIAEIVRKRNELIASADRYMATHKRVFGDAYEKLKQVEEKSNDKTN